MLSFLLWLLAYCAAGYVFSIIYEARRRAAQAKCIEQSRGRGWPEDYALDYCRKGDGWAEESHWHSDTSVLWLAFLGWPVYAIALIGLLAGFVLFAIGRVINPAKVIDKAESVIEARSEAKRGVILVEGKDETD